MKKIFSILICLVFIFSLLSGCSAASTTKTKDNEPSIDEKITLVMWDLRTENSPGKMIDTIIGEFEKANPNITIKRSAFKVDDLRNTIKPAIMSGKGPDIFSYDAGAGYLGVLANSDMALDLTTYAEQYGWNDRFHDWVLNRGVYNDKLYGIPNELEVLGVFYNSKMFSDLGVETPTTYDQFIEICAKFKENGITPVLLDDKDQWPGFHYESMWLNSFAGPEAVKEAVANEAPWNRQEFGNAMSKLYDLVDMGYTTKNPLGSGYDDTNRLFYTGQGAMRPTGMWMVGQMVENMGDDVGFFGLPPATNEIPAALPGGLGEAVVINAKTEYPDETAKFLDFMFSDEMIEVWYEAGLIPPVKDVDYSSFELSPLFKSIVDEINNSTELGENIDVLMPPKVNEVTKNYVQELIAGIKTGQECMDAKQEVFEEEIAAGNYTP